VKNDAKYTWSFCGIILTFHVPNSHLNLYASLHFVILFLHATLHSANIKTLNQSLVSLEELEAITEIENNKTQNR